VAETGFDASEDPIWALGDATFEGRLPEAFALLDRIEAAGVPHAVLLGALASHARRLSRLRAGGRVAAPPFALRRLEAQARRYSAPRLEALLRALADADERLKGRGELPPGLALERLLLALAS
jgi:DNA polymerase III delta subunit